MQSNILQFLRSLAKIFNPKHAALFSRQLMCSTIFSFDHEAFAVCSEHLIRKLGETCLKIFPIDTLRFWWDYPFNQYYESINEIVRSQVNVYIHQKTYLFPTVWCTFSRTGSTVGQIETSNPIKWAKFLSLQLLNFDKYNLFLYFSFFSTGIPIVFSRELNINPRK